MTQDDLLALKNKWCRRLRLQDWDIDLRLVRYWDRDLDNGGKSGCVFISLDQKAAGIKILDPVDNEGPETFYEDPPERALIHELIHLPIQPFCPKDSASLEHAMMEQCVSSLARAFYDMEQEIQALTAEVAALKGEGRHVCEKVSE